MADRVDVKLKAKDPNNENTTTTISYVNPEASNSTMKQFAQKLNALTRNTYSESDKIETTNLDLAPDSGQQTPTFTINESTITVTELTEVTAGTSGAKNYVINYNGDGQLSLRFEPLTKTSLPMCVANIEQSNTVAGEYYLWFGHNGFSNRAGKLIITASATATYKAAEIEFTITE